MLLFTAAGQAATNFGLAVNRRWQNRQSEEREEAVSFFDVTCWRDLAENVAISVTKDAQLIVTGRLEQRSWETDEKEKRHKIEVIADEVGPSLRWATAEVRKNERSDEVRRANALQLESRPALAPSRGRTATRRQPAGVVAIGNGQAGGFGNEPI